MTLPKRLPNQEKLTNSIDVLSYEQMLAEDWTDAYGLYPSSRIISPIVPVVVRQNSSEGPKYQEAEGYTFLINSVKFPGLTGMDDGRLVLTLSGVLDPNDQRTGLILFSDDEGRSWTKPKRLPAHRAKPVNLGGQRLMLFSETISYSEDGGKTWSNPEPCPSLPDGRPCHTDVAYNPLVEGDTVTFMLWTPVEPGYSRWETGELFSEAFVRRYHIESKTWDDPIFLPRQWGLNEGSLIRAANGDLVAAIRTQMIGVPIENDHWMGLATTVSTDNGKTWSKPGHHFRYGRHHCTLLNLPDGRILMTYLVRIGQLDGKVFHGIEAVISNDNGQNWDWDHRYIISRHPLGSTHSPQSVRLSDGRILTVFQCDMSYTWTENGGNPRNNGINLTMLGNVSVVIWN